MFFFWEIFPKCVYPPTHPRVLWGLGTEFVIFIWETVPLPTHVPVVVILFLHNKLVFICFLVRPCNCSESDNINVRNILSSLYRAKTLPIFSRWQKSYFEKCQNSLQWSSSSTSVLVELTSSATREAIDVRQKFHQSNSPPWKENSLQQKKKTLAVVFSRHELWLL